MLSREGGGGGGGGLVHDMTQNIQDKQLQLLQQAVSGRRSEALQVLLH